MPMDLRIPPGGFSSQLLLKIKKARGPRAVLCRPPSSGFSLGKWVGIVLGWDPTSTSASRRRPARALPALAGLGRASEPGLGLLCPFPRASLPTFNVSTCTRLTPRALVEGGRRREWVFPEVLTRKRFPPRRGVPGEDKNRPKSEQAGVPAAKPYLGLKDELSVCGQLAGTR